MSHLKCFRVGWRNESLAYYILSSFAFLDQPSTIGDDLGIDFYCTIFNEKNFNNVIKLIPSEFRFAIQIKSNKRQIDISKSKLNYIYNLYYPLIYGILDKNGDVLHLYSNDAFDFNISLKWPELPLRIRFSEEKIQLKERYFIHNKNRILYVYKFLSFSKHDSDTILENKVKKLVKVIQVMRDNIFSRLSKRFVFFDPFDENRKPFFVMGKDSFNYVQMELNNIAFIYLRNMEWFESKFPINHKIRKDIDTMKQFASYILENYSKVPIYQSKKEKNMLNFYKQKIINL